jgi:hypothetical protein
MLWHFTLHNASCPSVFICLCPISRIAERKADKHQEVTCHMCVTQKRTNAVKFASKPTANVWTIECWSPVSMGCCIQTGSGAHSLSYSVFWGSHCLGVRVLARIFSLRPVSLGSPFPFFVLTCRLRVTAITEATGSCPLEACPLFQINDTTTSTLNELFIYLEAELRSFFRTSKEKYGPLILSKFNITKWRPN